MIARVYCNEQALAHLDQTAGLVEPRLRAHAVTATGLFRSTTAKREIPAAGSAKVVKRDAR